MMECAGMRAMGVLIGQYVCSIAVIYLDTYCIRYGLRQRGRCHVGGEDSVMESALALAGLDPIRPSGS